MTTKNQSRPMVSSATMPSLLWVTGSASCEDIVNRHRSFNVGNRHSLSSQVSSQLFVDGRILNCESAHVNKQY